MWEAGYKTNLFVAAAPDIFLFRGIVVTLTIFFHSSFQPFLSRLFKQTSTFFAMKVLNFIGGEKEGILGVR